MSQLQRRKGQRERANNLKSAKPANLMKYTAFCDNDKAEMTQWLPVFIIVFIGSFIASCSVSVALLQLMLRFGDTISSTLYYNDDHIFIRFLI